MPRVHTQLLLPKDPSRRNTPASSLRDCGNSAVVCDLAAQLAHAGLLRVDSAAARHKKAASPKGPAAFRDAYVARYGRSRLRYPSALCAMANSADARQIAMQTMPSTNMSGNPPAESITRLQNTAATALMSEPAIDTRE